MVVVRMNDFVLETAVVFCVFNRLSTTKKVFEKIREAKPPRLYIICDAARESVAGEKEKVEAVRNYIEQNIDWECEVHKDYAKENMGCGKRIPDGVTRMFETEERAIILEDDCVPAASFFRYCQEMLDYYNDDERIMMISGNNPYAGCYESTEEYLFSKVPFIWGWATWRRAWKLYDFNLESFPAARHDPVFKKIFPKKAYWVYMAEFEALYRHKYDAWDYQFMYAGILNDKLSIAPAKNHVFNIGFYEESTHTNKMPEWIKQEAEEVNFPIRHRKTVEWDRDFDMGYFRKVNKHGLIVRIKQLLGLDINRSVFQGKR